MISILGAGLSGLSAAYHMRKDYIILEKEQEVGGLCKSVNISGFIFDFAPHILFTRDPYTRELFFRLLKKNLLTHDRRAYIYMNNTFIKYPFEVNLHPLPKYIIEECINGVLKKKTIQPKNFLEWIQTTFGDGIAKHYMVPYNQKVWKYDLRKMNSDWVAGRVPSPNVEEMKKGAEKEFKKNYGPNAQFWYPKHGGIGVLTKRFSENLIISNNSKVIEINPLENGLKTIYKKEDQIKSINSEYVLSSLPLPELVSMIDEVPSEVLKAVKSLIYNSIVCVNLGVKRPNINDKHWLYFPEKDVIFNRISFPMNFSPYTTPKKRSSILVEVTYRGDAIDIQATEDQVIKDLVKTTIIKENEEIEVSSATNFKYAYVIYDLHHKENVKIIHDYLRSNRIIPIGRFGEWEYQNMDKAIFSGMNAVKKFNEGST
jgi:UDP-galactopyranose mutase